MGPFEVAVAAIVFGSLSSMVHSLTRLRQRRDQAERPALEERLTRIEHAVDAIATEVERLAESQQFTSRLLAERLPPGIDPAAPDRRIG